MTTASSQVSPEQRAALGRAVSALTEQFQGTFGPETVERVLHSSYELLARQARITTFLPLLAERFARQRLDALAKKQETAGAAAPAVLFLCTHNAGRSQMALGFFRRYAGEAATAWSGGSEPGPEVNPSAVSAMAEVGIDISEEFAKPWTEDVLEAADVVVTMGCGDACPLIPGKRYLDWELTDPAGLPVEQVRPIRDEIQTRVLRLLYELGVDVVE